eukprot:Opistho-2@62797
MSEEFLFYKTFITLYQSKATVFSPPAPLDSRGRAPLTALKMLAAGRRNGQHLLNLISPASTSTLAWCPRPARRTLDALTIQSHTHTHIHVRLISSSVSQLRPKYWTWEDDYDIAQPAMQTVAQAKPQQTPIAEDESGSPAGERQRTVLRTTTFSRDSGTRSLPDVNLRRVLVVSKQTRYEYERARYEASSDNDVRTLLAKRGSDYEGLKLRHDIHTRGLEVMLREIERRGVEARVVRSSELSEDDVHGVDAVFSAGGDGIFLQAAGKIYGDVPAIGVNTDPERSAGHLCIRVAWVGPLLDRILSGTMKWMWRQRMRVSLIDADKKTVLRQRALNEIMIAESNPWRTSYYEMFFDGRGGEKQKSSGLIVCTGTGSTAWLSNIAKIDAEKVRSLLEIAGCREDARSGVRDPAEIAAQFNASIARDPAEPRMQFVVREPIVNGIFGVSQQRGFAKEIVVRSRGWDMRLVIDGASTFVFNDGRTALVEMPEEDAVLTPAKNWRDDP